ncbi:hypothetical protein [Leptospira borgpetersenii]|uniref:Uncharacterized protein n=1 Tax=Leptospira borgpetersenii serovar Pomona str. 200901868 TaxID=1192866 RepID=M6WLH2_LEPBO|nr:hypothetical protein [Leptospira borgpetersenii]EMO62623.1 hypothetical protein LEP1GSC133_1709 [Leptospira borgpetersenii serovar Pomona str. 200901868]MBE8363014.1 hypothetical protein [Leptospira borgpetersenii serovar Balcanica]MBE8368607.1 hypothetical protein [Leptospira borgpetersenii serovar Balcanica]MBE8422068.1 hypothetical protein [Leptospira borgpetersenii serovar Balcanica]MBF3349222.1 hypothetical protein [Leptospira borgpetersenii serovar Balcanica]
MRFSWLTLKSISNFSFIKNIKKTKYSNETITLIFENSKIRAVLEGEQIEAQFKCLNGFLLITSYNYYDGTDYWYYFLNNDLEVKDMIFDPYVSFLYMEKTHIINSQTLQFSFLKPNQTWRLVIHFEPFWDFSLSAVLKRPFRFVFKKRILSLFKLEPPS